MWTQAREGLNVTTLLCSNRRYKILQGEVARSGITDPGPMTRSLTDLSNPTIGWASIAQGMGVPVGDGGAGRRSGAATGTRPRRAGAVLRRNVDGGLTNWKRDLTDDELPFQAYYPENRSHCYGCGTLNEHGLHIESRWDGDESVCRFEPQPYHMASRAMSTAA